MYDNRPNYDLLYLSLLCFFISIMLYECFYVSVSFILILVLSLIRSQGGRKGSSWNTKAQTIYCAQLFALDGSDCLFG